MKRVQAFREAILNTCARLAAGATAAVPRSELMRSPTFRDEARRLLATPLLRDPVEDAQQLARRSIMRELQESR